MGQKPSKIDPKWVPGPPWGRVGNEAEKRSGKRGDHDLQLGSFLTLKSTKIHENAKKLRGSISPSRSPRDVLRNFVLFRKRAHPGAILCAPGLHFGTSLGGFWTLCRKVPKCTIICVFTAMMGFGATRDRGKVASGTAPRKTPEKGKIFVGK